MQAPVQAPGQVRGARKVPQWVFLGHLFHDVILADRVAMGASGSTTQANTLRRVLLASAAVVCLIFAIGFLASYGNNRRLESEAVQAASGISAAYHGYQDRYRVIPGDDPGASARWTPSDGTNAISGTGNGQVAGTYNAPCTVLLVRPPVAA